MPEPRTSEPSVADPAANEATIATVRDLEQRRWRAIIDEDVPALQELVSDDLIYTHTNSRLDNKASMVRAIAERELDYQSFVSSDESAACFGDVVVLAGQGHVEVIALGTLRSLVVRYSSIWARQTGDWQFVCWHSTSVPR